MKRIEFKFRFPEPLGEWIKQGALKKGRTVNAHVMEMLRDLKDKQYDKD